MALIARTIGNLAAGQIDQSLAPNRLALVIGINRYTNLPDNQQLQKAANDARSMKSALEELDFTVSDGIDLSRSDLVSKISDFEARIGQGDIVFFFFAGHGVAIDGQNFLLPADVPCLKEGQPLLLRDSAYPAAAVIAAFQPKARLVVAVLDACRNSPFERSGTRSLKLGRGLAPMQDFPTGTFILYSAAAGQTALDRLDDDDPDQNSVFTRVFLKRLRQQNLTLLNLVSKIRKEVRDLASAVRHEQFPAYYDEVVESDSVYLVGARPQGQTEWFQDLDLAPKMVVIPEGYMICGARPGEPGALEHEKPTHEVGIKPFALSRAPITVAQWQAYARDKGFKCSGKANSPVVDVSWDDANAYAKWLREKTSHDYRLPTEAEWEYAARAGRSGTLYSWGDRITPENAYYARSKGGVAEVEQFEPNDFGLYDMHGNVAEWVADSYHKYDEYLSVRSNGSAVLLDVEREGRAVVRGGSWCSAAADLRCASRRAHWKTQSTRDIGFRVAREIRVATPRR
jgi:formylglycine-generating enzyme required for sulfatase activity